MLSEGLALSLLGCGTGLLLAQLAMVVIHKLPGRNDSARRSHRKSLDDRAGTRRRCHSYYGPVVAAACPAGSSCQSTGGTAGGFAWNRFAHRRSRVSGVLVAAEVALSTLLLVGTGLLFHTLGTLNNRDSGLNRRISRPSRPCRPIRPDFRVGVSEERKLPRVHRDAYL